MLMHKGTQTIETERLILRRAAAADAEVEETEEEMRPAETESTPMSFADAPIESRTREAVGERETILVMFLERV